MQKQFESLLFPFGIPARSDRGNRALRILVGSSAREDRRSRDSSRSYGDQICLQRCTPQKPYEFSTSNQRLYPQLGQASYVKCR